MFKDEAAVLRTTVRYHIALLGQMPRPRLPVWLNHKSACEMHLVSLCRTRH